ncbi:MAG: diguanylate cyclase [Planctomycetota bacterium]|nr:MAG: diguanylate cyclase [Planctomycetota bacterium]
MKARVAQDLHEPIPLGNDIWWVGQPISGDRFQCHVYLLEHGDQSVLLDPGSVLTFEETRRKVASILPIENIRYFVCHHQDPDITGAMPLWDQLITRDDAYLISHWRGAALIKHLGLKLPFWLVDEHEWQLDLGGRQLQFEFTPYLHFPGAFTTFDRQSGTLFSSDLFGGFTDDLPLIADDASNMEGILAFHQHYMPSREVLLHSLSRLEKLPLKRICPQHGRILPEKLIPLYFSRLKDLDCGLYMMSQGDTDIRRLLQLNHMLRSTVDALILERDFATIAQHIQEKVQEVYPVSRMDFLLRGQDCKVTWFSPENRFRGREWDFEEICRHMPKNRDDWMARHGIHHFGIQRIPSIGERPAGPALLLPMFSEETGEVLGMAWFALQASIPATAEFDSAMGQISRSLGVAMERERLHRELESERDRIFEQSMRDALTGLYTRRYMEDSARRLVELHALNPEAGFSVLMLDIDHFKSINDRFGHLTGDQVIRAVAKTILNQCHGGDVAVRFGGEEFAVFLPNRNLETASTLAEAIRAKVSEIHHNGPDQSFAATVSCGAAEHQPQESLAQILERADQALYQAKEGGRNRVCLSD